MELRQHRCSLYGFTLRLSSGKFSSGKGVKIVAIDEEDDLGKINEEDPSNANILPGDRSTMPISLQFTLMVLLYSLAISTFGSLAAEDDDDVERVRTSVK
nr:hypothetical protein Iba_chr10aCG8880 [Ipomoea batatas]